jgi:hypothetical protein
VLTDPLLVAKSASQLKDNRKATGGRVSGDSPALTGRRIGVRITWGELPEVVIEISRMA